MNENRTIHLIEVPIGGKSGYIWNRLHAEREDICEALLKSSGPFLKERQEALQARLRKVDDALDRLMAGSYGSDEPWTSVTSEREESDLNELRLESLEPFGTILLRTHNSDYRMLVLDPKIGRVLVSGGDYLLEPTEALVKGSAVAGDALKPGMICVGCRLEMWVDDRVFLTSPIKSMHVKHNSVAESVEEISAVLH